MAGELTVANLVAVLKAETGEFTGKMVAAGAAIKELQEKGKSNFEQLSAAGGLATKAIVGGLVTVGVESVHLADQFETAHARLVTAIKNAGGSFDKYAGQIHQADEAGAHFGFTTTDVESALGKLTTGLQDPTKAIKELSLAEDIAKYKHIDLASAADMLVKIHAGGLRALKDFGIEFSKQDETAKGVAKEDKAAAGAADALAKAQENLKNVQERLNASQASSASKDLTQATKDATKASDDYAKSQAAIEKAQQKVSDIEARIAAAKKPSIAMEQELQHAQEAVTAAEEKAAAAKEKLTTVQDAHTRSTGLTVAQQQELQRAQDAVTAAQEKAKNSTNALMDAQYGLTHATDEERAIALITARVHGQAEAQAQTFAGQVQALKATVIDLGTQLGIWLIPKIEEAIKVTVSVVDWFTKHKDVAMALGAAVGSVLVVAIGAYIVSMGMAAAATIAATWPLLAIGAAIAVVAGGVIYAYTHFSWFRTIVSDAMDVARMAVRGFSLEFGFVKTVFEDVWSVIKPIIDMVVQGMKDMKGPLGSVVGVVEKLGGLAGQGIGLFGNIFHGDSGGVVPGALGSPQLAVLHGGETVLPTHRSGGFGGGGGGSVVINVNTGVGDPTEIGRQVQMVLLQLQKRTGSLGFI